MIDYAFRNLYSYSKYVDSDIHPFNFYWAPVIYLNDYYYYINILSDEECESGKRFYPERFYKDHLNSISHPPNKEYSLRSDEFLLAFKCKRRPVICLPSEIIKPYVRNKILGTHTSLVIPVYSLYYNDGTPKLNNDEMNRLKCCFYPQFLPLPHIAPFPTVYSFARFDMILSVKREYMEPIIISDGGQPHLEDETHYFLCEYFKWFLKFKVSEKFTEIIMQIQSLY